MKAKIINKVERVETETIRLELSFWDANILIKELSNLGFKDEKDPLLQIKNYLEKKVTERSFELVDEDEEHSYTLSA